MYFAALFVILSAVCAVLAFVRHPIYGLYFYLAATYVFPPSRWWGYLFGGTRWSLIAAGITLFAILLHQGKLQRKPVWLTSVPAMVFVLYAAWMWIQSPWVLDLDTHLKGSLLYTKSVVAFWFVYRVVDTRERVRDLLLAHVLGCALLGILAFYTGRLGDRLDGVGGPGMDEANTLGLYFGTGAISALGLILTERGWRRWLSLACAAIIMNGLVLTNTRGAFLGLVAGGLVLAYLKAKAHRRLFWMLAVVGLVGVVAMTDQKFIDRMSTIQNATSESEGDSSAYGRLVLMQAQFQMFLDYPMGTGHRGTAALSPLYLEKQWLSGREGQAARSSHNTFMTTLVEQGIPGALLFLWLTLWTVRAMRQLRSLETQHRNPELATLAAAVGGGLAVILVAGNTADFLLAEVQFWLFAALVSILRFPAAATAVERPVAKGAIAQQGLA